MQTIEEFLRKHVQEFESLCYVYFKPEPIDIDATGQLEMATAAQEEQQHSK